MTVKNYSTSLEFDEFMSLCGEKKCKETNEDPALALLAVRNMPIATNLLSTAQLMFQRTVDNGLSFKSSLQHNTAKVINKHRQCHVQRYDS